MNLKTLRALGNQDSAAKYSAIVFQELDLHFLEPWTLWAQPKGPSDCRSKVVLFYSQEKTAANSSVALELKVFDDCVEVPKLSLPAHLRGQGIMLVALGKLSEVCARDGTILVISNLVDRFRRQLIARNAAETLVRRDAVMLHAGMNFAPAASSP